MNPTLGSVRSDSPERHQRQTTETRPPSHPGHKTSRAFNRTSRCHRRSNPTAPCHEHQRPRSRAHEAPSERPLQPLATHCDPRPWWLPRAHLRTPAEAVRAPEAATAGDEAEEAQATRAAALDAAEAVTVMLDSEPAVAVPIQSRTRPLRTSRHLRRGHMRRTTPGRTANSGPSTRQLPRRRTARPAMTMTPKCASSARTQWPITPLRPATTRPATSVGCA